MGEENPDLTPIPVDPRPFSTQEAELVDFLLGDPFAAGELRAQAAHARVVSRCGCGCASVNVEVDPAIPAAEWDPADSPDGRADWMHLTANGSDAAGTSIEVTLHVGDGYLCELEIWTGRFGEVAFPAPDTLRLEERLPVKTQYALACALAGRLLPLVPDGVELVPTRVGALEIRAGGEELQKMYATGGLESAAELLLWGVDSGVSRYLDDDWLPCPAPHDGDDEEECPCSQAHAELAGGELRLWYGEQDSPTLALPPLGSEELGRLSELWSAQFSDAAG